MSRIDHLITELCPDGVIYRSLSESGVAHFKTGAQLNRSDLSDSGEFPVYNGGVASSGRHSEANAAGPAIIISQGGASAGYVNFVISPFWAGAHCYVVTPGAEVEQKFLYFALKAKQRHIQGAARGAGIPGLSRTALGATKIPVPPREVQNEIVNVLDQFTQLEAELEAELESRRVQHAYYWEQLLTPRENWRLTTVGGVAQVFDGPHATPKKTPDGPWYLSISSLKGGRFDFVESAHLSHDDLLKWTRRVAPRRGDTLFSYETRLGQAAFWDVDEPAALGRRMGLLRPDTGIVDARFLTLAFLGPQFQSVIRSKTVTGSTVDRIPIADMASWPLYIPPLDEQRRIVERLDQFDALVNDLSFGLPAELAARRKQYEYYRDRLLAFKEASA